MATKSYLTIGDLRGGRNGADAPLSLPDNQCVEAMNVDWYEGTLAHKRHGASPVATAVVDIGTNPSGPLSSVFVASHSYADYFFTVDGQSPASVNPYLPDTAEWSATHTGDRVTGSPEAVNAVTFNNRTYVCYDSGVDRLHFWTTSEPSLTHYSFVRVGILAPDGAVTCADQGSGTYAATTRYYKSTFIWKTGSDITNRSELSGERGFTPSGTGASVRVTQQAITSPPVDGFTHWEIYGSTDNVVYRLIATVEGTTLYYDDTSDPTAYAGAFAPVVGTNTPPGSWKYVASSGNRLLGVGNWEGGKQSRVWFTPIYGASDIGDAERVPTSNYVDLDAYDGDAATGIVGSFQGNVIVFKGRQIWKLVPTGDATAPYSQVCVTSAIGCIAPKSIVLGEDESGNPALYFMSHRGPYRLGAYGLEYCGRDIEDITRTMNQDATVVCHAVWHPAKHQVWFWVSTGTENYPTTKLVLDTHLCKRTTNSVRCGWSRHNGVSSAARCSCNFGPTLTSGARFDTVPYVGAVNATTLLLKCDDDTVEADNGTPFQAYVETKPYALGSLGFNCSVGQSHLTATAEQRVTITQTITRDYGVESRASMCDLSPRGSETLVQRQFDGSDTQGAGVVQFRLGDGVPVLSSWTLDALVVPFSRQEER